MTPQFSEAVVGLLEQLAPTEEQAKAELFSDALDQQTLLAAEAIASLRAARQPVPSELAELIEAKVMRLVDAIAQRLSDPAASKPIAWQETSGKLWQ
jgi:hypothetical protein